MLVSKLVTNTNLSGASAIIRKKTRGMSDFLRFHERGKSRESNLFEAFSRHSAHAHSIIANNCSFTFVSINQPGTSSFFFIEQLDSCNKL